MRKTRPADSLVPIATLKGRLSPIVFIIFSLSIVAGCGKEESALDRPERAKRKPPSERSDAVEEGKVYEVGGDVSKPVPIYRIDPELPQDGRDHQVGTIRLKSIVRKDGSVSDIEIVYGPDNVFTRATIDTVRQWVFTPAKKDDKPVDVYFYLTFDNVPMTLDGDAPPPPVIESFEP